MPAHPVSPSTPPAAAAYRAPDRTSAPGTGPILVATAGTDDSDAALWLAYVLVGRTDADVMVTSVVEPLLAPDPAFGFVRVPPLLRQAQLHEREATVSSQLERTGMAGAGWHVEVVGGDPARILADRARATDARLLVLGRTRRPVRGWHDADLALRLLQLGDAPVLAVPPGITRLPQRVVLATDFTPYSLHAGQVALRLAADGAFVHLVHVRTGQPLPGTDAAEWSHAYEDTTRSEFARVQAELGGEDGHGYETVTLTGNPADALAEFAAAVAADLVVCGAHGRGFVNRLFVGSVAAGLLHRVPCAVLCVPGSAVARAAHHRWVQAGMHTVSVPRGEWGAELARVSRQCRGRRCTVEVEQGELGAQHLADGLPFEGADHDAHGDRVTLRLGVGRGTGRSLAHAIPDATQLDLVADDTGTTHVLRVGDATGQTLVTFTT